MKKGWQIKKFGAVCTFDKVQGIHRNLPYIGLENIESHTGRFIGSIDPQLMKSSTFRFSNQHILYGRLRPYLNKVLAPDFEGHCSTELFPIKPFPGLTREYLLYWLLSDETVGRINETCTGARMPRADMNEVLEFSFPLPPLPEQHRIVGILDSAFADIATARANAENNLQNARALFESHLQSVFTQLGEEWVKKTVGEVCDFRGGGTPSKAVERYWTGKIPWVSPKDMKSEIISDSIDHISQEAIDSSATSLIPKGAVLMVVRSGILARIVPLAVTGRELTINQDLKALCPKNVIKTRFFYNLLKSKMPVLLSMVSRGATVHRLQTDQIRSLTFFLPPIAEQDQITNKIDTMRVETQHLESLYQQKLTALDGLKKSLLHQAFSGQL